MSIELNKVFKTWGKQNDTSSPIWKDYWTYITAALDGSWGTNVFTNGVVIFNGKECYWKTSLFVASNTLSLTIPVQSNEGYAVQIMNTTTGVVTCKSIGPKSSAFSVSLTSGNTYQIISNPFIPIG